MNRRDRRSFRATKKRGGYEGLSPVAKLFLAIIKQTGRSGIDEDNVRELANDVIGRCGSIEAATEAIESGLIRLQEVALS